MSAGRCGSRVEGVVRSCDTAFRPGGNIIEHYVYRFVAAGRACLVSNLAKSCYTEHVATLHGPLFLSVSSFFQRGGLLRACVGEIITTDFGVLCRGLRLTDRKLLGICRRSFGTVRQGSLE